jgi:hypothetical protein
MQFLKSIEGKTKRDRIKNEKNRENLKLNTLENKLTNNIMRWSGHVLQMNEERILKKFVNRKVKGKCPRGRLR